MGKIEFFKKSKLILFLLVIFLNTPTYAKDNSKSIDQLLRNENQIVGVEIILVSGLKEQVFSRFGHIFIRFISNETSWVNDFALSFIADIPTKEISLGKGVFGGYPVSMTADKLISFWQNYVAIENRTFERYIVPIKDGEIRKLFKVIKSWANKSRKMGRYAFFTNNCTTLTAKLLKEAGLTQKQQLAYSPLSMGEWLEEALLSPYPSLIVNNPFYVIKKAQALLSLNEEDFLNGIHWPKDAATKLLQNLNELEIKFILGHLPLMPSFVFTDLSNQYNYRKNGPSFDQVMNFEKVDNSIYSICNNTNCSNSTKKMVTALWSQEQLQKKSQTLDFVLRNITIKENDVPSENTSQFNVHDSVDKVRIELMNLMTQIQFNRE